MSIFFANPTTAKNLVIQSYEIKYTLGEVIFISF